MERDQGRGAGWVPDCHHSVSLSFRVHACMFSTFRAGFPRETGLPLFSEEALALRVPRTSRTLPPELSARHGCRHKLPEPSATKISTGWRDRDWSPQGRLP